MQKINSHRFQWEPVLSYSSHQSSFSTLPKAGCCAVVELVSRAPRTKYLDGYQILACDGFHVVYATDPKNVDDYVKPRKEGDKGYNQLHLNALYCLQIKYHMQHRLLTHIDLQSL